MLPYIINLDQPPSYLHDNGNKYTGTYNLFNKETVIYLQCILISAITQIYMCANLYAVLTI